jgi:hypothetical protein
MHFMTTRTRRRAMAIRMDLVHGKHMRALQNGGQRLSAEAREPQFRKMFNLDTGKRRLTCKSRLPVPESIVESERRDEWPGMS